MILHCVSLCQQCGILKPEVYTDINNSKQSVFELGLYVVQKWNISRAIHGGPVREYQLLSVPQHQNWSFHANCFKSQNRQKDWHRHRQTQGQRQTHTTKTLPNQIYMVITDILVLFILVIMFHITDLTFDKTSTDLPNISWDIFGRPIRPHGGYIWTITQSYLLKH